MKVTTPDDFLIWSKIVLDGLKENGVHYWLCGGSLLGAIRNSALIEWDTNINVGMYYEDIHAVGNIVQNESHIGISDIASFQLWNHKDYRWGLCRIAPKHRDSNLHLEFIEIDFYKRGNPNISYKFDENIDGTYRSDLISPIGVQWDVKHYYVAQTKLCLLSGFGFEGPKYPNKYLRYRYGDDWRIPEKNYTKKFGFDVEDFDDASDVDSEIGEVVREWYLSRREYSLRCVIPLFDLEFSVFCLRVIQKLYSLYDYVLVVVLSDGMKEVLSGMKNVDRVVMIERIVDLNLDFCKKYNIDYIASIDGNFNNSILNDMGMIHDYVIEGMT